MLVFSNAIQSPGCTSSAQRCRLPFSTRQAKVHRLPKLVHAAPAAAPVVETASLAITPEYGYVIAAVGFGALVCQWMGFVVGFERRKIGLKYPAQYSGGASADEVKFDCVQRAHMNTLENAPMFTVMVAVLGIMRPIPAASLLTVFFLSRIAYFLGYASGDSGKRGPGLIASFFTFLAALVFTIYTAGKTTGVL